MTIRTSSVLAAFAAGGFLAHVSLAHAADVLSANEFEERHSGQAVSAINFKIEGGYIASDFGGGGEFKSGHGEYVQGSASLPLGSRFGLQIDAGYLQSDIQGQGSFEDFGISGHGFGGHLFWRDPEVGLVGLYGHQTEYEFDNGPDDQIKNIRLGVEGEAYLGNFTIKGFAGNDTLDWNFAKDAENFLVARGQVDFYLNDNFMIFAGVEHAFEETTGKVGLEAMFDTGSISSSIFGEARMGDDSQTVMAGLRVYFGPQGKSLKARHREDDPANDLFSNLGAIGSCMNMALEGDGKMPSFDKIDGIFPGDKLELPKMMLGPKMELDGCSSKTPKTLPF